MYAHIVQLGVRLQLGAPTTGCGFNWVRLQLGAPTTGRGYNWVRLQLGAMQLDAAITGCAYRVAAAKTMKRATHKNAAQLGAPTTRIWICITLNG
jgi:hypothetical protein